MNGNRKLEKGEAALHAVSVHHNYSFRRDPQEKMDDYEDASRELINASIPIFQST
jgi:hypothetical protein